MSYFYRMHRDTWEDINTHVHRKTTQEKTERIHVARISKVKEFYRKP